MYHELSLFDDHYLMSSQSSLDSVLSNRRPNRFEFNASKGDVSKYFTPKRVNKKKDELKEHDIFLKEVENGVYAATDEEAEKITIIPHFNPPRIKNLFKSAESSVAYKEKQPPLAGALTPEELAQCRNRAYKRARQIYFENMDKFFQNIENEHQKIKKLSRRIERNHSDIKFHELIQKASTIGALQDAYYDLLDDVEEIEQQNVALKSHIIFLAKAKQSLNVDQQCLIQGTEWQRKEIQKYKEELENNQTS